MRGAILDRLMHTHSAEGAPGGANCVPVGSSEATPVESGGGPRQ